MVALLQLSKAKANEELSTNTICESQDGVLSSFNAAPQHHSSSDIDDWEGTVESVQTAEV